MGFIKVALDALKGSLADQWLEYYEPNQTSETAAIFWPKAVLANGSRGENNKLSEKLITNGSKISVPEQTALITMQDGKITGLIAEPGAYIFTTDDVNSKSIFASDGIVSPLIKNSWERFKFAGIPSTQQLAFYVNLKEIPNNRFGTSSEIYWDDAFLNTQVGAITRGTYSLKITDPILFVKNLVPQKYLTGGIEFDFQDLDNDAVAQLFDDVVASLASAFSMYTNDPSRNNRISKIQSDALGFARALGQAVNLEFSWKEKFGLEIVTARLVAIEYDEDTKALLSDVKKADALSGGRGNSFLQQSVARGIQAAGENGADSMAFMGVGINSAVSAMNSNQQNSQNISNPFVNIGGNNQANTSSEDPYAKLVEMKKLLDAGVISQEEFDAVKKKVLGL